MSSTKNGLDHQVRSAVTEGADAAYGNAYAFRTAFDCMVLPYAAGVASLDGGGHWGAAAIQDRPRYASNAPPRVAPGRVA